MTMRIVFRTDAGPAIGSGHVMRSLALGRAFSARGWKVSLAATRETFASVKALAAADVERIVVSDKPDREAAELAAHSPIDILVVDHYGRGAAFERACRDFAKRIIAVDDLADRAHECDLVVD